MKQQGSEPDDSMVGLVASFVGINIMLGGLAVILGPHLVFSRIRRSWRARKLAKLSSRTLRARDSLR